MTSTPEAGQGQSALMVGSVAEIVPADRFPCENVLMARDRYSYEGNWLFCAFEQADIVAARIGFGLGRFHWQDYGLEAQQDSSAPLAYRLEVVTPAVVHACLYSDQHMGVAVESDPTSMEVKFSTGNLELFHLHGWPQMSWQYRSPDASIAAELQLSLTNMAVWPDCVMPNNTFSMCIGVGAVRGSISIGGRRFEVTGGAVYDHPRVVVRSNDVPLFGWYLYAPLRFPDGTFVVSYYSEDGSGRKDESYSTGFVTLPDGSSRWLRDVQISRLEIGRDGLPIAWQAQLVGDNVSISYRTSIVDLSSIRSSATPDSDHPTGKYLAFPLLMETEGECRMDGVTKTLRHGSGIAEFLVRKGHRPVLP
ncbi:MAG: hypothetical protein H6Q05_1968 [Acidobacteria bacterium]|nr:hypothetical protein [Acidobacteriota bacterium]